VKALRAAVWATAFGWGLMAAGAAKAQGGYFAFRVCNTSGLTAYIAILNRTAPGNPVWRRWGWLTIHQGCTDLGSYPQGWFYFMAEAAGGVVWKGPNYGKPVCVVYPGPFDRPVTGDYLCSGDEQLRYFNEVFIDSNIAVYSADLN